MKWRASILSMNYLLAWSVGIILRICVQLELASQLASTHCWLGTSHDKLYVCPLQKPTAVHIIICDDSLFIGYFVIFLVLFKNKVFAVVSKIFSLECIYSFSLCYCKPLCMVELYAVVRGVFTSPTEEDDFTCTSYVSGGLCFSDTSVWCSVVNSGGVIVHSTISKVAENFL